MGKKMTLILAPEAYALYRGHYMHGRPLPLVLGVLQGALRTAGHRVSSFDVSPAVESDADPEGWKALFDVDAVLHSLRHGGEGPLRARLDALLDTTDAADCDAAGVSWGADTSVFQMHAGLLLAARIMARYGKRVAVGGANTDHVMQFSWMYAPLIEAAISAGITLLAGPGDESLPLFLEGAETEALPGAVRWADGRAERNAVSAPTFVRPDFDGLRLEPYTIFFKRTGNPQDDREAAIGQLFRVTMAQSQALSARNASRFPLLRQEGLVLPYYFNSGCVFNCAFCVQSRTDWTPYCSMAPQDAVRDLKLLSGKYQTPYIRFFNNAFNLSMRFTRAFCDTAKREKLEIYFSDCGRFNGLTDKDAVRLYEAGCRKLVFGLDSASPTVLRFIDKQLDLEQVRNGLRSCRRAGIDAELEVIVGMPGEGRKEFQESYDFIESLVSEGLVSHLNVNRYFVLPASRFGQQPQRYGIALDYLPDAYKKKAERELEQFRAFLHPEGSTHVPMRIDPIRYFEPGGRSADQIAEDTLLRYRRMRALTPGG